MKRLLLALLAGANSRGGCRSSSSLGSPCPNERKRSTRTSCTSRGTSVDWTTTPRSGRTALRSSRPYLPLLFSGVGTSSHSLPCGPPRFPSPTIITTVFHSSLHFLLCAYIISISRASPVLSLNLFPLLTSRICSVGTVLGMPSLPSRSSGRSECAVCQGFVISYRTTSSFERYN